MIKCIRVEPIIASRFFLFHVVMSRKGPSKNQYSQGLTYVANTPSFLRHFGQAQSPPASPGRSGREPLPSRPKEGKWAGGSDDEGGHDKDRADDGEDDEWGETFGGGGEEGPQVVVLKEGRHLTAEEVKRERRRGEQWLFPIGLLTVFFFPKLRREMEERRC